MEVMVPMSPAGDFDFYGPAASPYMSAPSSPKPFGDPSGYYMYASAPTSPARAAAIYSDFSSSRGWEESYRSSKPDADADADEAFDFAAGISVQLESGRRAPTLAAADELFEGGRIRPLKPPPDLHRPVKDGGGSAVSSSFSSSLGLCPGVAMEEEARGRGRAYLPTASPGSRKGSRSLSPLRGGDGGGVDKPSVSVALAKGGRSNKWRLRDLFLFRSASEGRATGRGSKDPLRKYSLLSSSSRISDEDTKIPSIGSSDNKLNAPVRRGGGPAVSAHEMHYAAKRAAEAEQKKKTPLPYRRNGLFGFLHFYPVTNTSGSFARHRR